MGQGNAQPCPGHSGRDMHREAGCFWSPGETSHLPAAHPKAPQLAWLHCLALGLLSLGQMLPTAAALPTPWDAGWALSPGSATLGAAGGQAALGEQWHRSAPVAVQDRKAGAAHPHDLIHATPEGTRHYPCTSAGKQSKPGLSCLAQGHTTRQCQSPGALAARPRHSSCLD